MLFPRTRHDIIMAMASPNVNAYISRERIPDDIIMAMASRNVNAYISRERIPGAEARREGALNELPVLAVVVRDAQPRVRVRAHWRLVERLLAH